VMIYVSASLLLLCAFVAGGFRTGSTSLGKGSRSSIHVRNTFGDGPNTFVSENDEGTRKKTAVIVGAGPAGLAAALVLSKVRKTTGNSHIDRNFFERIVVLEDSPKESYDPSRAYFYNINKRGQRFTNAFDIDLTKRGLEVTEFAKLVVPTDPNDVFDDTKIIRQQLSQEEWDLVGSTFWIPRQELVQQIADDIDAKNEKNDGELTKIEVRRGARCKYVEPTEEGLVKIVIETKDDDGDGDFLVADLCVGADGILSNVRRSLENGRFDPEHWSNAKNPSKKFGLKKYTTPSTGLRIKGLCVQPNFAIPKGGTGPDANTKVPLKKGINYALQSATKGATDSLNLFFLPVKDPDSKGGRCVNICLAPNHDVWDTNKLRTDDGGRSAKAFFEKAFPRFDWDEIVAEDEWELFASTEGSRFPQCQYSPSLYVASKPCRNGDGNGNTSDSNSEEANGAGVVLIGDALHAFPPDLGQGVNSALNDAMVLGKCFEDAALDDTSSTSKSGGAKKSFVSEALESYQKENGPETRSLIELARCGAPYQYEQQSPMMKLGKNMWKANLILRLLLNKVTLGLSPKPAILMMMDPRSSFRQIMRKANTLTAILWSSLLFVLVSLVRARVASRIL